MQIKLALKTLATVALLFSASAVYAEDPVDTPLPGDVQAAPPASRHQTHHRASKKPAASHQAEQGSDATPHKKHARTTRHRASVHRHSALKNHKAGKHASKKIQGHKSAARPVAPKAKATTAVKSGTNGKTNLKTAPQAKVAAKPAKPLHAGKTAAKPAKIKPAKKPAAHKKSHKINKAKKAHKQHNARHHKK